MFIKVSISLANILPFTSTFKTKIEFWTISSLKVVNQRGLIDLTWSYSIFNLFEKVQPVNYVGKLIDSQIPHRYLAIITFE